MTMNTETTLCRTLVAVAMVAILSAFTVGCGDDVDAGGNDGNANLVEPDAGTDADDQPDADGSDTDLPDADEPDTSEPDAGEPDADEPVDPDPPSLAVDALRPDRGTVDGGTHFVIDGEGFTSQTVVLFGAAQVETVVVDGALTGVTPPSDVTGPVTVRVIDELTGEATLVDGFTYVEPLEVELIQPWMLPVDGGVEVTLEGRGFSENTRVVVGDSAAGQHEFVHSGRIRFVAPPHPEGPADLRLIDDHDHLEQAEALTYVAPVELDSVAPPYGSVDGGDEVTLYGAKFDDTLQVFFDEVPATNITVAGDGTSATATTPAGTAGLVDVRVETASDGDRIIDGFAYLDSGDGSLRLDGVVPDRGGTAGGERVYLTGYFPGMTDPLVTFGAQTATLVSAEELVIAVDTPGASNAGAVDVTVEENGQSVSAVDGFTYFVPLQIDTVTPEQGDVGGGTDVVVTGSGFDSVDELRLAGLSVDFEVIDDETIEFTTPAASPGPADLQLFGDDGRSAIEEEAFFFLADLELWSFDPIRGSIAGNTYVEIRGTGFTDDTEIFFGGEQAPQVERLNAYTLAVRTPPHPSDVVEVTGEADGLQAQAPELYTYFNPGSATGGAWGNPIDGAVNVTVFTMQGQPIEGSFVMLSTIAQTPYSGVTDATGRVTLSGPDVFGEQTVTATAPEHTSTTVQYVDAENVTIFLHPEADGDPPFPPPPPTATFSGQITGLDKLATPAPDEILMAYVESTRPSSIYDPIPDPGGENMVFEDGEFQITTRIGELALVATAGLYNTTTEEFTPIRMGVARYLVASDGGEYEVDIPLDIPLNSSINVKFDGAPMADNGGPETNRVQLFIELGADGIYGPMHMQEFTSTSEIVPVDPVAKLAGDLSDANYFMLLLNDTNGGLPYSQSFLRHVDEVDTTVNSKPIVSTIDVITPASGAVPNNGLVQWNMHGIHQPDLYWVIIETFMQEPVWDVFLPGDVTSFQFPDFPDLSEYAIENDDGIWVPPLPYPGGTYQMIILGISKEGLSIDDFAYDDLNLAHADGFSVAAMIIGF